MVSPKLPGHHPRPSPQHLPPGAIIIYVHKHLPNNTVSSPRQGLCLIYLCVPSNLTNRTSYRVCHLAGPQEIFDGWMNSTWMNEWQMYQLLGFLPICSVKCQKPPFSIAVHVTAIQSLGWWSLMLLLSSLLHVPKGLEADNENDSSVFSK